MNKILSIFVFILLCQSGLIHARQPYQATVTVDTTSATINDPNLVDLTRDLDAPNIQALIPIYTPTSAVSIDINLRGLDTFTSFAENSTTLDVLIPQANIVQSFTGATREDSLKLFKDFIRDGGNHPELLQKLLKAYARYSPIDPIAGNPNSLMAQMAESDYLIGRLSPLNGCSCGWSAQPIVHQFQSGLNAGRAFAGGFDTTTIAIPSHYSYSPNLDWAFVLDAPLVYNRNGGASSVFGSLGVGLHLPVTHEWSLTPLFRTGFGGSLDLCTSGSFIDAGLTSVYNYKVDEYVLSMTNYAGYFSSINLWLTGVNFNYQLHNYIFKNGLSLTTCRGFVVCNRPLNFSLSFEDSCFTKDRLYIRHYDEVALSLILNRVNPCLNYDCLSLKFAYQFGQQDYKGYFLDLAYQF